MVKKVPFDNGLYIEVPDGDYAAVEIKFGCNQIEEATKNLLTFQDNMLKKPKFIAI